MNCLLAGAALPVHSRRWSGERKTCGKPRLASDVEPLLADLRHISEHDVVDLFGFDAGSLDEFFEHHGAQDDWMDVFEFSIAAPDRCSDCLDDHHFAHFCQVSFPMTVQPILGVAINRRWDAVSTPQRFAWQCDFLWR